MQSEVGMSSTKWLFSVAGPALAFAAGTAVASAQESPPSPTPAPVATATPSFMDVQYDGRTHVMVAPYVWGPTVKGNFQYSIPTLPHHPGRILQSSVQVGPSDYVPKLNSALMLAFDARKGDADLFGDVIYLNASTNATIFSTIGGPLGKVHIPVTLNTNARLAVAIWEAALGFTLAHGHNADLSLFVGAREFPLDLTLTYNATIGKRGIITPSGTVKSSDRTDDVIFGLRGKAFFGDGHWYVPYYADIGSGFNNSTWEGYTGAGYTFNHGQTIIGLWRALNYYAFPPTSHVQKLSMGGPLLGYTFQL
jgi:hypothetical protein